CRAELQSILVFARTGRLAPSRRKAGAQRHGRWVGNDRPSAGTPRRCTGRTRDASLAPAPRPARGARTRAKTERTLDAPFARVALAARVVGSGERKRESFGFAR